jgi:KDO2-lipid IV(A) lauroyltransferase
MSAPTSGHASGSPGDPLTRPTILRRTRFRVLIAGTWLLCRVPERPLLAIADLIGNVWYRLASARRDHARRNLARVTRWMAEHEVGSERGRLAGRDPKVLEELVRAAFRQSVRYNLILARGSTMDARYVERWMVIDTLDVLHTALAEPAGALFVGLHMGSMELPALYLSQITGRPAVAPTETLSDPLVQAHLVRARSRLGLRLVELSSAKREMVAALRRRDPVGIVGDRDLTGGGIEVQFFGAPSSLPVGPALLALETGVIPHVFGVRRTPDGVYHATVVRVPFPERGTRRERVTAYLVAEAQAFEHMVAMAPEQWFAVFFEIWKERAA